MIEIKNYNEIIYKIFYKGKFNFINKKTYKLVNPNVWLDRTWDFINGFGRIELNEKQNYIKQDGTILYKPDKPDEWFNYVWDFNWEFGRILLKGKENFIKTDGTIYIIQTR